MAFYQQSRPLCWCSKHPCQYCPLVPVPPFVHQSGLYGMQIPAYAYQSGLSVNPNNTHESKEQQISPVDDTLDESNSLELSPEMKRFLAQSAKRKQRKAKQRLLEEANKQRREPTQAELAEQEEREMNQRYGTHASDIRALESALDCQFDRLCDELHCPMWPVEPLNSKPRTDAHDLVPIFESTTTPVQ